MTEIIENLIKVYVKLNNQNIVIAINSSVFITDIAGWLMIDEGQGDKYAHAQSQYLEKGLIDSIGRYNYKYFNGIVELSDEEKEQLFPKQPAQPTEQELINAQIMLEIAMLKAGI